MRKLKYGILRGYKLVNAQTPVGKHKIEHMRTQELNATNHIPQWT